MVSSVKATTDVLVVGAGLAGLRCAADLTAVGRHVTVLEASDGVGGRVRTDQVDGYLCDRGFQVLNPSYPAVRRRIDVAALDLFSFDAGALVRTERGLVTVADPVRAPALALRTLRSGLLSPADLVALSRWLAPVMVAPQRSMRSPDRPLGEELHRIGANGHLRRVLDRFLAGVLVDSRGTSSANFTRLLIRSFALGRPGLPRSGMGALPAQIAQTLPDVRLGHRALSIARDTDGYRVETEHGRFGAPTLVIATEGPVAAALSADGLTATGSADLPEPGSKGLTTWWWSAEEAPGTDRLIAVDARDVGKPPGPVWNTAVVSNAAPSYAPPGRALIQATTLHDRPDGEAPEAEVRRHAGDIFGCDTSRWELVIRHRIPHALPALPPPMRAQRRIETAPGLYVCGDHRDTASIQGALVSGERTAVAINSPTKRRNR